MSELKFRCLVDDNICDILSLTDYVEKGDYDLGLVLIAFAEDELDTIRKLFKDNIIEGRETYLDNVQLEGSDGYLYIMSQTSLNKKEKMPYSIFKAYKQYSIFKKKEQKGKDWIKENNAQKWIDQNNEGQNSGLIKLSGGRLSSYKFIDKENEMCFPLRLLSSKSSNRPLFVLFHGAGAMGNDNIKQLFDHIPLYRQVSKLNCNILAPQAPFGSNRGDALTQNYIKSVKKLIDELPIDFDRKRIYVVGTSFGGFCVWNITYLFPGYFAAAVPVMGGLSFSPKFDAYDVERLTKTPLWVAHSSDDTNVRIDSDDYFVAELQKLGVDVKYTRWNKYGHSMYKKFYKTEKWAEWCLSKELKFE